MQATCQCGNPNNPSKVAAAELQHKLDLLLRTGSILMESAADTSRIRRTMKRAAAFLSLDERYLHFYINWNVLMVNYSDTEHSFTKFQRCEKHGINLTSIAKISKLTWSAISNDYSLDQYEKALDDIQKTPRSFTPWQVAIGGGFACGGFCVQFGCDWPAFFYCSLAAILGFRLRMFLPTRGCNNYIAIGIAAFVSTLIAWVTTFLSLTPSIAGVLPEFMHSSTPWHPLMACALFIVPGVPLINFVSDMLDGYIEVGMVRALNTLLMVLAMAFHDLSRGLYAVASLYLISLIMDRVVYGGKRSKVACIVSDHYEELTAALLDMNRGITLLSGEGGYTHQARKVILCAFGKNQIIQLKKRVQQVDPDAFIIVYDANEVLGKGFGSYEAGGL